MSSENARRASSEKRRRGEWHIYSSGLYSSGRHMLTERQKHTVKKSIFQRALAALAAAGLALCVSASVLAQQGGTTRYVYDEDGRLHAVISPSGEAVVYEYDAAGNITAVRRLAADALAIFTFSPRAGIYGDLVTFVGSGFGGGISDVSFNGASARVVDVTPSTVVAEVPQGATTGLVTITTPRGSVTTTEPFGESAGSALTRYDFTGRERDSQTGLIYYRA